MVRRTFLVRSSTADINIQLNEVLTNVVHIDIAWVQCPPITANLDDFLYIIEDDANGQLEANGSSSVGGFAGNPPRSFLTLPAPSATEMTTYNGNDYPISKPYTTPFTLTNIKLRVCNRDSQPVTFDAGFPEFGMLFIVTTL